MVIYLLKSAIYKDVERGEGMLSGENIVKSFFYFLPTVLYVSWATFSFFYNV